MVRLCYIFNVLFGYLYSSDSDSDRGLFNIQIQSVWTPVSREFAWHGSNWVLLNKSCTREIACRLVRTYSEKSLRHLNINSPVRTMGPVSQRASLRLLSWYPIFNTVLPRQNGHHFSGDILEFLLFNENVWMLIKVSLNFLRIGLMISQHRYW